MSKLVVSMVLLAVGAQTHASGWRDLRIDATTQSTFEKSVADFQRVLPPERRLYFEVSLQEIWRAVADDLGSEATMDEAIAAYFKRLDGLRYQEVIRVGGSQARKTYVALVPTMSVPRSLSRGAAPGMPPGPDWGFTEQSATGNWSAGAQAYIDRNGGR